MVLEMNVKDNCFGEYGDYNDCDIWYSEGNWYCKARSSCMKKTFELKKILMVNNPKGYNHHNKNPFPVVVAPTEIELFLKMDKLQQYEKVKELYQQKMKIQKDLLPLAHKYKTFLNAYFGIEE